MGVTVSTTKAPHGWVQSGTVPFVLPPCGAGCAGGPHLTARVVVSRERGFRRGERGTTRCEGPARGQLG